MDSLSGMRVVVAGGGVIGSAVALAVRRAGAEVVLADPAALGDNASGVAAGMLAPAFESVLDPVSTGHFELYRRARDLWPELAGSLRGEAAIERCGALWVAPAAGEAQAMAERLAAAGAEARSVSPDEAHALSPGLGAPHGGAFTPEDWRLQPAAMLDALQATLRGEGGQVRRARLMSFQAGRAELSNGEVAADAIVLASGRAPEGFAEAPVETALLSPIKGQILHLAGGAPRSGPVLRGAGVYVVPAAQGPWVGATMEAGADDRRTDPATAERLLAGARVLFAGIDGAETASAAGVRAATPDGLPLVGASSRPGVWLALGARRNGWLLAPMIAGLVATSLAGGTVPARLDARRFDLARAS